MQARPRRDPCCPSRSTRSRSRCATGSSLRTGTEGWLLPGAKAGTHISADTLRGRLKRYGIGPSRAGRHAALLALAARLPAPILAERIGIHQARAAQWVRLAGSTYVDYVADRASVLPLGLDTFAVAAAIGMIGVTLCTATTHLHPVHVL